MRLSIIVPAYNEEAWLAATLEAIEAAATRLLDRAGGSVEMIVVDNNSSDRTAAVALMQGATVIHEPVQGIARSRNAGARHANGEVLVFVDADVIVPPSLLEAIHSVLGDPACLGGAVDVDYRPRRRFARLYLRAWRRLAELAGMAQGATQFCRASAFEEAGGYDEQAWIGGGRRLLLEPQAARPGHGPQGRVHPAAARGALDAPLRQVAAVAGADLDEPAVHRAAAPPQGGLDGLVRARGALAGRPTRAAALTPDRAGPTILKSRVTVAGPMRQPGNRRPRAHPEQDPSPVAGSLCI